jgi:large subunit ribosomal protein L3
MPGQYGNERVTVKGLKVVGIDAEKDIILIRGAVPGANQGLVVITAERD